tara:strand:+ start:76 stop:288 length:213 start_codon:yes stop_codon:yes gene_type:complete
MNEQMQQAQAQMIQLKARIFDLMEEAKSRDELLGAIAQKVGFKGQSASELLEAIPAPAVVEEPVPELAEV